MNATEAYHELLEKILSKGRAKGDRTGTGTHSIFTHALEIDMLGGFPLITTKKMFTKGIVHELLWFLNGDTNIKYLVDNGVNIWNADAYREYNNGVIEGTGKKMSKEEFVELIKNSDEFAKVAGDLGPIYGKQWVNHQTNIPYDVTPEGCKVAVKVTNQIQDAIDTLNNNPDSRRIIVNAWNVAEVDQMALPPCHWAFELYTEELTLEERIDIDFNNRRANSKSGFVGPRIWASGNDSTTHKDLDSVDISKRKISLKWHQRSVDTFLGLPFNIASYGFLLHMFAQQTNMAVGSLVGDLTNVHIYQNHMDQVKEQLTRDVKSHPRLELNKAKDIFTYGYDDFKIVDYNPHPSIKGEISV